MTGIITHISIINRNTDGLLASNMNQSSGINKLVEWISHYFLARNEVHHKIDTALK